MKRDMDLIRDLMLRLEEMDNPHGTTRWVEISEQPLNYDFEDRSRVLGHLKLLSEANLIDGGPSAVNGNLEFRSITWAGHDFLDSIRDPDIWEKTKSGASAAGGFTIELLGDLAKGFIKRKIKQQTGIDI